MIRIDKSIEKCGAVKSPNASLISTNKDINISRIQQLLLKSRRRMGCAEPLEFEVAFSMPHCLIL